jgi:chromosome segregation ATPase
LQNPMNAAEISNNSGKTLDGGPITVFEGGAYAGEALVETFKAGDKRMIAYGIDLGTRITTAYDSSRDTIREIHATRGVLNARVAIQETQTYTIRNVDAKAKTLIIEHPSRPGYTVLNVKPVESTATAHRFEVKLSASGSEKFAVTEENLLHQSYAILSLTPDQLATYIENKALSADGRKQLEAIAAQKRVIAETDQQLRDIEQEINELVRDQDRIRQNLSSLNRVTGQEQQTSKYARELADQESRLAGMRDRQSQLRKQKAAQEQQLKSLIEKISF